ncbi:MAG: ABC transporter permease subunit [Lachnospiraceae bacterium]|nr:ABC transporter permease subunit [Lachnospiraceae bacterium]
MKTLMSFIKKEFLEQVRTSKIIILFIIFVILGIMNPAVAKLTPALMKYMSEELAQSGITINEVTITALDSWVQFYKNIPMGLLVFILIESSILTREYQSGTLILSLTKGFERYKVIIAKTVVLCILWTVLYFMCFGITYGYNAYFWDNSVAHNLVFSVMCYYIFGLWIISLMILFSVMSNANTIVLAETGLVVFLLYLLSMIKKVKEVSPTTLMDGTSLVYGLSKAKEYNIPLAVAILTLAACLCGSIPIFNKKQL